MPIRWTVAAPPAIKPPNISTSATPAFSLETAMFLSTPFAKIIARSETFFAIVRAIGSAAEVTFTEIAPRTGPP